METLVSNRIYCTEPTQEIIEYCERELVVTNPTYEQMMRLGKENLIRIKHIPPRLKLYVVSGNTIILPFGVLYAIWPMIKNYPVRTKFNDAGQISCINDTISQPLYDYQETAVKTMVATKGGVLVAPCSAGKTNIMIEIIHRIGRKFLFIVHTSDLLRQFYSRAKSLYPNMDIGQITDGKIEIGKDGAVATIQTLDKIDKNLYAYNFDIVICDECVHVSGSPTLSKMFSRVLGNIPARYKFGCTATPERSDTLTKTMYTILGVNLQGTFAPIYQISKSDTRSLTAEHIRINTGVPFDYHILNDDGTFNYPGLIDYLSLDEDRNNLIVDLAKELIEEKRKTIILCHRIQQCEIIHQKLLNAGIKSELLVGKVSAKKREAVLTEQVDFDCICATYSLCKEGIDVKSLEGEILCTPVNDKGMMIQCVGRVERFKEGKRTPLVLDLCDEKIPYCVNRFKKRVGYLKNRY